MMNKAEGVGADRIELVIVIGFAHRIHQFIYLIIPRKAKHLPTSSLHFSANAE